MMKQHGLNLKAGGAYYMPRLYDFLGRLRDNNNREWFKANKAEYDELRALWLADIDVMLAHMSEWWPSLRSVTAKGCAYRIYRHTRFSLDKTPLKTYFSAGTGLNGRSSHDPGFYLQLGPSRGSDGDESGLYGGLWCPDAPTLKKVRKAIVDNIEEFEEIVHAPEVEKFFPGWCGRMLKTIPKGYDRSHPQAHFLRMLEYGKFYPAGEDFFYDPSWPVRAAGLFSHLRPFVEFLDYSIKEEV